jgi:hypothetical protein
MGLHLCYELDLPIDLSDASVGESLQRLQFRARGLPFEHLSAMFAVGAANDDWAEVGQVDPLQAFFDHCAIGHREADGHRSVSVRPLAALGFVVRPGRLCEAAAFGLARYPEAVTGHPDPDAPGVETRGWHWHSCCKTQYASVLGEEHLIRCHLSLVSLLDEADQLGFPVTVRDETHYSETRKTDRLLAEVHEMNRIVARVAGRIGDALPSGLDVGGAITRHPRFEELEME